jgi:hypothetical protein
MGDAKHVHGCVAVMRKAQNLRFWVAYLPYPLDRVSEEGVVEPGVSFGEHVERRVCRSCRECPLVEVSGGNGPLVLRDPLLALKYDLGLLRRQRQRLGSFLCHIGFLQQQG